MWGTPNPHSDPIDQVRLCLLARRGPACDTESKDPQTFVHGVCADSKWLILFQGIMCRHGVNLTEKCAGIIARLMSNNNSNTSIVSEKFLGTHSATFSELTKKRS
eukprot:TRINITY_DN21691_c0_g1_i1.p1 TRINITY_DN21691_c0_g1~~TRINITY_DN21691_c0_g1_i1.p1  ORF type:complete len:105 (-),score=0.17 TRINITY_DN21691_c0_g1_i1:114-428(-)